MPDTQAEARAEITQLVANFCANEPSLAGAPEAQIEDTYIRRLFRWRAVNPRSTPNPDEVTTRKRLDLEAHNVE